MPLSKWPNKFIKGSGHWLLVCFPITSMMTVLGNYGRSWADVWLGPAYRVHQVQLDPQGVEGTPRAAQLCKLAHPLQNHEQGRSPNDQGKTLQQGDLIHRNDVPNWRAGVDQGGTRVPHQNAKGNPHNHPLVPQGLVLQVSNCVSICETWSCRLGPRRPGVGWSKVEPPPRLKKTPRSRSDSTSMKSWAVNLPFPQVWLSSCLGEKPSSDILLLSLLQQGLLIHHGLTMKRAPNRVPPPLMEPDPKSSHLLSNPHWDQRDQIQWATPTGRSMQKCWRSPHTLVENPDAQWQEDNVLSLPMWEPQQTQSPSLGLLAGSSIPATPGPRGNNRMVVPPITISGLHLKDYMPYLISSDFHIMRQHKTMA